MPQDFLVALSHWPFPQQFTSPEAIEKVRSLLGDELVVGAVPAPGEEGVALVYAITGLGRAAVARVHLEKKYAPPSKP